MAYANNQPLGPIQTSITEAIAEKELGDQVPFILTPDANAASDSLKAYYSLSDVENDYDVDSNVYKTAKAILEGTEPPEAVLVKTYLPGESYVSPVGISTDLTTVSGTAGTTVKLTPTVLPANATDKTVKAVSSDTSIFTASPNSDGTITVALKGAGNSKLTLSTGVNDEITTVVPVHVAAAKVAVTGVTLDKTTLSGTVGGTDQLTASVKPSDATNQTVTFASSDPKILTVDNTGKVTYVAAGTATVTATTADGNFTATSEATVKAAS